MKIEDIHCVLIIGAGTMGQQIGLQCAMHAYDVILYDIVPEALQSASAQINSYAAALVDQNRLSRNDADAALSAYPQYVQA